MIKGAAIPQVLLSNLIAYLVKRPYEEVAGFLAHIQQCPAVDMSDDGKQIITASPPVIPAQAGIQE